MVRTRGASGNRGRGGRNVPQREEPEASQPPQDPPPHRNLYPLLTLQKKHRVQEMIEGKHVEALTIRHGSVLLPYDARYEPYLRQSGFFGIVQIKDWPYDDDVLNGFIERWRQETHSFNLSVGEMTITLQDVAVLLGLPIYGVPICNSTDRNWEEVVHETLGIYPEGRAMSNKSALSLSWIKRNFSVLPDDADEARVQCHVRAYILYMLGTFLLPDLSGGSITCIYLPMLQDLEQVHTYAWGAAVLGRLYRQLCHAVDKESKQISGCLALLQFWIWERFPVFRPKLITKKVLQGLNPETMPPRGFEWSKNHEWKQNPYILGEVRVMIDNLQDNDVNWTPYTPHIMQNLPPIVNLQSEYWLIKGSLIDFAIVETYHPERVMRQFGLYQRVPPPSRSTLPSLHDVDRQRHPKKDWLEEHRSFVDEWNEGLGIDETRPFEEGEWPEYLRWYNGQTIVTLQGAIGIPIDPNVAVRAQRRAVGFKNLVAKVIKFAKKAANKMKTGLDPKFASDAFKLCRDVVRDVDSAETFEAAFRGVDIPEDDEESAEESDEESDDQEVQEEPIQLESQVINTQAGPSSDRVYKRRRVRFAEEQPSQVEEEDRGRGTGRARGRARGR